MRSKAYELGFSDGQIECRELGITKSDLDGMFSGSDRESPTELLINQIGFSRHLASLLNVRMKDVAERTDLFCKRLADYDRGWEAGVRSEAQ